MGQTKSIAAQTTKGKRVRMESPEPPTRNKFGSKKLQKKYEEIKNWAFIPERRVHLLPE